MNVQERPHESGEKFADFAVDRWENEGGAHGQQSQGFHYGRRVEADRSWTVFHVFTGVPAYINGNTMIGLTQRVATDRMLSLNRCNEAPGHGGSTKHAIRTQPNAAGECRR